MAIQKILRYPDPRLHQVAKPVDQVDARIQHLIDDMAQTMYDAPGIGLAATQIDVHERVITIDVSDDKSDLLVLINPKIVASSQETKVHEEGCLSVPGIYEEVERADRITVEAINRDGESYTLDADGILAVCIQHEIDHLDGRVFVEHLSRLKRGRIKTKMLKLDREEA